MQTVANKVKKKEKKKNTNPTITHSRIIYDYYIIHIFIMYLHTIYFIQYTLHNSIMV